MPSCDTNRSDPHFSSRNPTLYKHSLSYQVLLFGQWSIFSAKKSARGTMAMPIGFRRDRSCGRWATEYDEHGVATSPPASAPKAFTSMQSTLSSADMITTSPSPLCPMLSYPLLPQDDTTSCSLVAGDVPHTRRSGGGSGPRGSH